MIELPLEHHTNSDSRGGGSPITVQVTEEGTAFGQAQQLTAQVALVQSESPDESGQHYFTVTGELRTIQMEDFREIERSTSNL